jgi:hypothetical protein
VAFPWMIATSQSAIPPSLAMALTLVHFLGLA